MTRGVVLYSAVGDELSRYEIDVTQARLVKRESVQLPANAQYAWAHPVLPCLYIATSNRGTDPRADHNHVSAFRIDATSGALTPHGEPHRLRARAVHICVDPAGLHLLSAHNLPRPGITINRIDGDGTVGPEIPQPEDLDYGIYPHQVMVAPSNRTVILVDRGNDAAHGKAEDPGALRLFRFDAGRLSALQVVAPDGGYGFGPRHLDFHPTRPWTYVSLERQSRLYVYRRVGDRLEPEAAYTRDLLAHRESLKPRQLGGAVHVHPNGRVVYLVNRADGTVDYRGQKVFCGGENSIAVFAIDPQTGQPTLIQHADTHNVHVRTFAIDPSGQILIAGSIKPLLVRDGDAVRTEPASLSVFRIAGDGTLDFVRKYEVETAGKIHYWMGMVPLPVH